MIKLINGLDSSKYRVKVLLLKDSIVSKILAKNAIEYSIANSKFYTRFYQYFINSEANYIKWFQFYRFAKLSFFWILSRYYFSKKELSNHDFDIVHLNSSVLTDWLAPAKERGKVVIHIREPFRKGKIGLFHAFFTSQMRKHANRIIAISKDNAKRIAIPEKTAVIYNFAEIPRYKPPRSSYSSKKVLYLGGASAIKGFFTLTSALDHLDGDVKIYFGGNYESSNISSNKIKGTLKAMLGSFRRKRTEIQKIKNHPNAEIIGHVSDVEKYLNQVCCLISPFSVSHFSRPVIEAYLHRKPAIGTDIKGMDEIIKHEENGLIVPNNDPEKLAMAINELTADTEKAKKLGESGYNLAIHKFTPKNIQQVVSVYDKLSMNN